MNIKVKQTALVPRAGTKIRFNHLLIMILFMGSIHSPTMAQNNIKILNFNGDTGFVHDSKATAEKMIEQLGKDNRWSVTASADPTVFGTSDLNTYDIVVFNNNCGTDGPIFNKKEQKGLQKFMRQGGSFLGIHCAGAIWGEIGDFQAWYAALVGTRLIAHPEVQNARLVVENRTDISTFHLAREWSVTDEWHRFEPNPRKNVEVLISLDESSYSGTEKMNGDHPVSWKHEYDGGKVFYTTLGHTTEIYKDKNYRKHIFGGIQWLAGLKGNHDLDPIENNLILDLNADNDVVIEDGNKVNKWINQVADSPVKDFIKRDAGRFVKGSGRPSLKLNITEIRGHNTLVFHRQELVNHEEDAFDHLLTGSGYTWFIILAPHTQVPGLTDVSSFFGNLRNGGNYEGIWGCLTNENRAWMGSRSGKTFGRFDENNPLILGEKKLENDRFYLIMGRMGDGTDQVPIELFINGVTSPAAFGKYPVNWASNPSKMVIGQERDATNHPGTESFDGEISRFLLYDRPLSDQEMKIMANRLILEYDIKKD